MSGGKKNDSDKPFVTCVPSEAILLAAQAFTFGAKKYGRDNFKEGIAFTRLEDAAMRHKLARLGGEELDPESGLPHLAHELASLCMLAFMQVNRPELDDRYRYERS